MLHLQLKAFVVSALALMALKCRLRTEPCAYGTLRADYEPTTNPATFKLRLVGITHPTILLPLIKVHQLRTGL